jgi:ComF family protein
MLRDLSWKPDAVVPVPLSKARLRQRGYNQVHFLARPVALQMGIPFHPKAIAKIRETTSQVGLSRTERRKNIIGAFLANSKVVGGRSILLIDDVTTSGATIDACTRALLQAGAKNVFGLTLARSILEPVG